MTPIPDIATYQELGALAPEPDDGTEHSPIVSHWYRTETIPEEIYVGCTCGGWEFTSQESISGGLEPWGQDYDQHIEEEDR